MREETSSARRNSEVLDFLQRRRLEFTSDGEWKEVKAARGQAISGCYHPLERPAKYSPSVGVVEIARKPENRI